MKRSDKRKILPVWLYILIYAGVVAACIALDQLTKHFMELHDANGGGVIPIIGDWLVMNFTRNEGATGGLFSQLSWRNWLFFFMTLLGLPVFGWLWWRSRTRSVWGQVAFSFVIGGTIGNAIDRLFLAQHGFFTGEVRDFIQVKHFFGIFNIADSFLVVGVILALLTIVFFDPDSLVRTMIAERKSAGQKSQKENAPEQSDGAKEPAENEDNAKSADDEESASASERQSESADEKD